MTSTFQIDRDISVITCLAGLLAAMAGCAPEPSETVAPATSEAGIIGGTEVVGNAGGVVAIRVNPPNDAIIECSGVMLNPTWLLTARHCVVPEHGGSPLVVAYAQPSTLDAREYTLYWPRTLNSWEVYPHPTEDVALVHFTTQSGYTLSYSNPLYAGSGEDLVGKTLDCYGYGRSQFLQWGDFRLRSAKMRVEQLGRSPCGLLQTCTDKTNGYYLPANELGQVQWYGDSGGPCFLPLPTGGRLIAGIANKSVHSDEVVTGHWQAGADWFRDWVYATTKTVAGSSCVISGVTASLSRDRVTMKWHTSIASRTRGDISSDGSSWKSGGPPGTLSVFQAVMWTILTRSDHEYVFSSLSPGTMYQVRLTCAGQWDSASKALAPAPPTEYSGTVRTLP